MKRLNTVLASAAILVTAASAQAVIIGSDGGDIDVVVVHLGVFAGSACAAPLDVYEIHLVDVGVANDSIKALDVDIIPNPQDNTVGLHQAGVATPDMQGASALTPTDSTVDTHFNVWNQGSANFPQWLATVVVAAENNNGACGTTAGGALEGWGTSLSVMSALTPVATDLNVARVVVPLGATALLTGAALDQAAEVFTFGPRSSNGVLIPEPATLSLLALAGLAVTRRKRR